MDNQEIMEVGNVGMVRAPQAVLDEAKKAANALQSVIAGKKDPVKFNGQQYIEFEDWQVLARFYGLAAKVVSTTPLDFGGVRGFEARAVAVDVRTGVEVSAAEAMCLNDEDKWSNRAKYEWKGNVKTKVGEVPVPMFQLRSMAQTRACAKALRNVLAWVVVLAGYKPNVAEEMTGDEEEGKPPVQSPARASAAEPAKEAAAPADGIKRISDGQRKRFFAIWKGAGKTEAQVKAYLVDKIGTDHSADIPADFYEEACAWAAAK